MSIVYHQYFEPLLVLAIVGISLVLPGATLNLVLFAGSIGGVLYLVERVTEMRNSRSVLYDFTACRPSKAISPQSLTG